MVLYHSYERSTHNCDAQQTIGCHLTFCLRTTHQLFGNFVHALRKDEWRGSIVQRNPEVPRKAGEAHVIFRTIALQLAIDADHVCGLYHKSRETAVSGSPQLLVQRPPTSSSCTVRIGKIAALAFST